MRGFFCYSVFDETVVTLRAFYMVLTGACFAQAHKISVQKFEPPKYPAIARQAHIEGEVKVALKLSATGEVLEAKAINGHPMLTRVAVENAKKWRFHCDDCGYGERFEHQMTYSFVIDSGEHGIGSIGYQFPKKVLVYAEIPVIETTVGLFAPDLPHYFWLWKLFHPQYWGFRGFD